MIVNLTEWDRKYAREVMLRADEAIDALNGAAYLRQNAGDFRRMQAELDAATLEEQLEAQIESNQAQIERNRAILGRGK